jgi:carbonic anhydrase
MDALGPALKEVEGQAGDKIENAARCNVKLTVEQLSEVPILADAVKAGTCKIVGAYYDLATGKVELV